MWFKKNKLSIDHIINPVIVPPDSDLHTAQPITLQSMETARRMAQEKIDVNQYAAFFPEDENMVPPGFRKTIPLDRSVLDLADFKVKRKLPLLRDILDRLYENSNAEYFIYTNVDIALMPHFYLTVEKIIRQGYDGFIINRRTLPDTYRSVTQLPLMYAELGGRHPGHDCFVFKRKSYPEYILGNACIGAKRIARVLMGNVIAFSKKYNEFKKLHATFHIGDDQAWNNPVYNDYYYHNLIELMKIQPQLIKRNRVGDIHELKAQFRFNIKQALDEAPGYPETHYLDVVPSLDDPLYN